MAPMSVYPDIDLDSTGPGQAISEVSPFWRHSRRGRQHRGAAGADRACHRIALDRGQPRRRQDHRHVCWASRHRRCTPWAFALLETYAVPPLLPNQVLAIGVTSYNGMLYLGVNADREAMSDLDVPPSLLRDLLDELLEAVQRVAPAVRCGDE